MKQEPYSPSELSLLASLHTGGTKVTTKELIRRHYGKAPPKFPLQAMTFLLRKLQEKVKHNREGYEILDNSYQGPKSSDWWIDRHRRVR